MDYRFQKPLFNTGVFTHVLAAGIDPDGVVHDAVHNRIGVHPGAEALIPFLLGILRAEHGRSGIAPVLHQLQQHAAHTLIGVIEKPFIDHQHCEGRALLQEFVLSRGLVLCQRPGFLEVRHTDVMDPNQVLAGLLGQSAP